MNFENVMSMYNLPGVVAPAKTNVMTHKTKENRRELILKNMVKGKCVRQVNFIDTCLDISNKSTIRKDIVALVKAGKIKVVNLTNGSAGYAHGLVLV